MRAFGRFARPSSRLRSILLGATLVAGALVVPAPRAWAQSLVGDANGPKVQIFSPAYQDVLKGKSRILIGIAAGQYNPASIEFWVDGRPATKGAIPLTSVNKMSFDWDTHRFSDGPHKLTIRVTDTQGFRGVKDVNIYINNQSKRELVAPELKWKNVDAFQQFSGQAQVELETKNSFGVKWIIVRVTPTDKNSTSGERSFMLGGGAMMFKFDTTKVADGIYTLSAKAWDGLEQEGNAPPLTIGVVNSPINATTVGESLDDLRRMAQIEKQKLTGGASDPKNTLPALVKVPAPPVAVAQVNPNKPAKTAVPLAPKTLGTGPTVGESSGQLAPVFPPRVSTHVEVRTKTPKAKGSLNATAKIPQVAKTVSPDVQTRAVLSQRQTGVLSPAQAENAEPKSPAADKTFAARVEAPDAPVRVEEQNAALSSRLAAAPEGVLSPQRAASTEPAAPRVTQGRVEIARLALPEETSRDLQSAPTLSVAKAFEGVASSSPLATIPTTRRVESALVASAPTETLVEVETAPVLSNVAAPVAIKAPATAAPSARVETETAPQLSVPKSGEASEAVVTPKAVRTSPLAKIGPRIAARPSTPRPNMDAERAVPGEERAAITVSPIQTAFNAALPKQHLVKTETTLRALADHYGLPVEMVAAANNWNSNMRVIPGMVVLLPRQVQLSYNGQKVGGDVSSMLIGDTTVTAMRFLFEKSGGKLEWDAQKKEVVARKGASTIRVKIGSNVASVGDKQVMMQLAAFLFEGRTMVPARLFEEGLDAQVEWNPETGHLVVAMAN